MRHPRLRRALFGLFAVLTACATPVTPSPDYDALMAEMMRASFREQGIAKMDRLMQDASNAECSKSEGGPLSDARSEAIQTANYKSVKMPADGKFIGDWREGERLAQNGRGMTGPTLRPPPPRTAAAATTAMS
jgi:sulfur-oxidizing protein SoxX